MTDLPFLSIEYLLERALQCRRLAREAYSRDIASELEKLAIDYDKDAAWAEIISRQ